MSKLKCFAVFSAIALLLGMTGCKRESSLDIQELEKSLVGVWWDEFEYEDETEDGIPFSKVLLAVKADADHTGCIYLGVFDSVHDAPLAIYGGPEDGGFSWRLLDDGSLQLTESAMVKSTYGDDMTTVSGTSMNYADGNMTLSNGSYSGTLAKADGEKETEINTVLYEVPFVVASPAVGQVIGDDGKNYDYASLPGGVTAVARICYVDGDHGLALALRDEGELTWTEALSTCAAHTPAFSAAKWKLADRNEWKQMSDASGGHKVLMTCFESLGGTNMREGVYWTRTEDGLSGVAFSAEFLPYYRSLTFGHSLKSNSIFVRACLDF